MKKTLLLAALLTATTTAQAQAVSAAEGCKPEERGRILYQANGVQYVVPERHQTLVRLYADGQGIPYPIFFAQIWHESGFCQNTVSHVGALGLGQLMPATAAELGVDPLDAHHNVAGAAKYLRQQYDRFGSWELALAAYNAGGGNVRKWGGIPPFPETQNYVRKIMNMAQDLGYEPPAEAEAEAEQ